MFSHLVCVTPLPQITLSTSWECQLLKYFTTDSVTAEVARLAAPTPSSAHARDAIHCVRAAARQPVPHLQVHRGVSPAQGDRLRPTGCAGRSSSASRRSRSCTSREVIHCDLKPENILISLGCMPGQGDRLRQRVPPPRPACSYVPVRRAYRARRRCFSDNRYSPKWTCGRTLRCILMAALLTNRLTLRQRSAVADPRPQAHCAARAVPNHGCSPTASSPTSLLAVQHGKFIKNQLAGRQASVLWPHLPAPPDDDVTRAALRTARLRGPVLSPPFTRRPAQDPPSARLRRRRHPAPFIKEGASVK